MPIVVTGADGTEFWTLDKKLHRTDGPAVIRPNGEEAWYLHGQRHRVGDPAVSTPDGAQRWFLNDQLHRTDGPAMIWANGGHSWWLNGDYYNSFEEWLNKLDTTPRNRTLLALKWSHSELGCP